eukprot:4513971-Pleurochrysis_carterae.AAC.1
MCARARRLRAWPQSPTSATVRTDTILRTCAHRACAPARVRAPQVRAAALSACARPCAVPARGSSRRRTRPCKSSRLVRVQAKCASPHACARTPGARSSSRRH